MDCNICVTLISKIITILRSLRTHHLLSIQYCTIKSSKIKGTVCSVRKLPCALFVHTAVIVYGSYTLRV